MSIDGPKTVMRLILTIILAIGNIPNTIAEQPIDNFGEFASRVAYRHQAQSSSNSLGNYGQMFPGTLSLDGKHLLVNDFQNSKLVLIDVDSLNLEIVSSDPRILSAWFDSRIEAIFILKLRDDTKINENRNIFPTKEYDELTGLGLVDLHCFGSIAAIRDDKPSWVRPNVCNHFSAIDWLGSLNVFVMHEWKPTRNLGKTVITILGKTGNEIGQFEIPGQFLGADSSEEEVELFHVIGSGFEQEVRMSSINRKLNGLKNTKGLYFLPLSTRNLLQMRSWETGTRGYRLRGLKNGDVRKFITEVMSQPGYWNYEDITSLQFTLGWNPLTRLSPKHRQEITNDGMRFHNLGRIDALDLARVHEIVVSRYKDSPWLLLNHQAHLYPLTDGQGVSDAIILDEGITAVTFKVESSRIPGTRSSEYTSTISILTLDQNANRLSGLK